MVPLGESLRRLCVRLKLGFLCDTLVQYAACLSCLFDGRVSFDSDYSGGDGASLFFRSVILSVMVSVESG